jgi:hypothetical protein
LLSLRRGVPVMPYSVAVVTQTVHDGIMSSHRLCRQDLHDASKTRRRETAPSILLHHLQPR